MINFRLINTYIFSKDNSSFERLMESIRNQRKGDFEILLITIEQEKKILKKAEILKSFINNYFEFLKITGFGNIGLSNARNIGLDYASKIPINDNTFYLFPDDDCWFEKDFFYSLTNLIKKKKCLSDNSISLGVYDPIQKKIYGRRNIKKEKVIGIKDLFSPISVGLILNYKLFHKYNLRFNTFFGAGAFTCSGEETLLIAEILRIKEIKIIQITDLYVYHQNRDEREPLKEFRYSHGSAILALFLLNKKIVYPFLYLNFYLIFCLSKFLFFKLIRNQKSKIYLLRFLGIILGLISYLLHKKEILNGKFDITINLKGGIGNQIFQLFALTKVILIQNQGFNNINYDICSYIFDKKRKPLIQDRFSFIQYPKQILLRLHKYFLEKLSLSKYKVLNSIDDIDLLIGSPYLNKPLKIDGYFQNINPTKEISKKSILQVAKKLKYNFKNIKLKEHDYCSIHVRRTDFLDPLSRMSVISMSYYKICLDEFLQDSKNDIPIYVFSDDMNWVKENFLRDYKKLFIFKNFDSDIEDLIFMSYSKIIISSNSSFAVSSALISFSRGKLKKIFIPKEWFKDDNNRLIDLGLKDVIDVKIL